VRAVLFDKTAEENWALGWHQDRTIVVRERREVPGFGPWSTKQGLLHVAPPIAILEGMATFRIHIDRCGSDNAPLKVASGSHRIGYVAAGDAGTRAAEFPLLICNAEAGDVWAYSTPILHASDRAEVASHRRVLQVDYSAVDLPSGLEWAGVETSDERAHAWAQENAEAIADYNRRIRERGTIGVGFRRY
jgi:post-segregation antitoxin (ccd killing protein)